MSKLFHRNADAAPAPATEADPVATREWGEPGSVDYWIEAMKRAYSLGEVRALGEIERLESLTGPQPPMSFTQFPDWFWGNSLWQDHLAPYCGQRLAMPY